MYLEMEATQQHVTELEREEASKYLAQAQKALLRETNGLSEAQWKFKPAPDRWSITEILEHLVIVGDRFQARLAGLPQGPAAPQDRDFKAIDAAILRTTPYAIKKYQAPPFICPTGLLAPAVALEQFSASCASVDAALQSTPGLRAHLADHPAMGPLDGYQWILLVAAHIARHTNQVLEVKKAPDFPGD